jgi:hypothetical protein
MNILWSVVLSCGVWYGGLVQYQPYVSTIIEQPIFTSVQTEFQYGPVFLAGGIRTDMFVHNPINLYPYQNTWNIGGGLRYGPAEIGIVHRCFHPMIAYQWSGYQVTPRWEGQINEIYASVKLEGRL